nr:exopolysaccharide biosynthesis protein [Roseicitreum antarcticum]
MNSSTTSSMTRNSSPASGQNHRGNNRPVTVNRILAATDKEQVSVEDLVQAIGHASFTPVLLIPAIAVASPLSGIPMFSALMGILIFLVSLQMLLRRDRLWLPKWLLNRKTSSARVRLVFERLRPAMTWLDAHTYARLTAFVHRPLIFIPQTLCVLSGLIMPFLEFVPFSSSLVGGAVALLAFGMFARDGLFVMLGLALYLGPVWLVLHVT